MSAHSSHYVENYYEEKTIKAGVYKVFYQYVVDRFTQGGWKTAVMYDYSIYFTQMNSLKKYIYEILYVNK